MCIPRKALLHIEQVNFPCVFSNAFVEENVFSDKRNIFYIIKSLRQIEQVKNLSCLYSNASLVEEYVRLKKISSVCACTCIFMSSYQKRALHTIGRLTTSLVFSNAA